MKTIFISLAFAALCFSIDAQLVSAQDSSRLRKEVQDLRDAKQERREEARELCDAKEDRRDAQREVRQEKRDLREAIQSGDKDAVKDARQDLREARRDRNAANREV